jgi:hypothetical protein
MNTPYAKAVADVFGRLSALVFPDEAYPASPVKAYIAGGAAVHLYTGSRVSKDVDVEFAARLLRPEVVVLYRDEAGGQQTVHLDRNYSSTLGLMHEDFDKRAAKADFDVPGFEVMLLSPVDLAISKLGRFAEHDQADIKSLIHSELVDRAEFETLAFEALSYYVGNTAPVAQNIASALRFFGPAVRPAPGQR